VLKFGLAGDIIALVLDHSQRAMWRGWSVAPRTPPLAVVLTPPALRP